MYTFYNYLGQTHQNILDAADLYLISFDENTYMLRGSPEYADEIPCDGLNKLDRYWPIERNVVKQLIERFPEENPVLQGKLVDLYTIIEHLDFDPRKNKSYLFGTIPEEIKALDVKGLLNLLNNSKNILDKRFALLQLPRLYHYPTLHYISTLLNLFDETDSLIKERVTKNLLRISINVEICQKICDLNGLVPLITLLKSDENQKIKSLATATLANLAAYFNHSREIIHSLEAINPLLNQLSNTNEDLLFNSLNIFVFLAYSIPKVSSDIRELGQLPTFVGLLKHKNEKIVNEAIRTINNIIWHDPLSREVICDLNIIPFLVSLLNHPNDKIRHSTVKTVCWLSPNATNCIALYNEGAINPLVKWSYESGQIQSDAKHTINNIIRILSTEQVVKLLQNEQTTVYEVEFAIAFARYHQNLSQSDKEIMNKAIFMFLNEYPNLETSPELREKIHNYFLCDFNDKALWFLEWRRQIQLEIDACIQQNIPLTTKSYAQIKLFYIKKTKILTLLTNISQLNFPLLETRTLRYCWELEKTVNFECLEILHAQQEYADEKQRTEAKLQTLLKLLVESNDVHLFEILTKALNTRFFISDWRQYKVDNVLILDKAIQYGNIELVKFYFHGLSINQKLDEINQFNDEYIPRLMSAPNLEVLKTMLLTLSENERPRALNIKNRSTLLWANSEYTEIILSLLAEKDRLGAVLQRDYFDRTVLFQAIRGEVKPKKTSVILMYLLEKDRLPAITAKCNDDYEDEADNALHLAVIHHKDEILKTICLLLPKDDRFQAFQMRNQLDDTILHTAVYQAAYYYHGTKGLDTRDLDIIHSLLLSLTSDEQLHALITTNNLGYTPLHYAAGARRSKSWLDYVADYIDDYSGNEYVFQPELLKSILAILPENKRLSLLQITDNQDYSVLLTAAKNPLLLRSI